MLRHDQLLTVKSCTCDKVVLLFLIQENHAILSLSVFLAVCCLQFRHQNVDSAVIFMRFSHDAWYPILMSFENFMLI